MGVGTGLSLFSWQTRAIRTASTGVTPAQFGLIHELPEFDIALTVMDPCVSGSKMPMLSQP